MKILMYGWEFPPQISGGLGVACHAIVQELAKKHLDVTVVLPYSINNFMDQERVSFIGCNTIIDGLEKGEVNKHSSAICAKESLAKLLNPYLQLGDKNHLEKLSLASSRIANIIVKLKTISHFTDFTELSSAPSSSAIKLTGNYGFNLMFEVCNYAIVAGALAAVTQHDIIHAHDWLTILAGVEAKKRSGKPLIFHVHALEPDRSGEMIDTRIFAIEKYGMEQADKIVAVSEYTKNTIIHHYGIAPEKISIVHNGTYSCDTAFKSTCTKHAKTVLFLGRLAHQKGPFLFVEAARKILEKRKDVSFVIAGAGGLFREIIDRVAALRIGKHVHFTGFLDHKKIDRIFRLADVYVMPSISEPFGLTCLEALSCGVPVVISKQSGVAEVLPHVNKVDFWDTDEMANKILALLDHKALRNITLQQSKKDLQKLTWGKTADSLTKLYKKLVTVHLS